MLLHLFKNARLLSVRSPLTLAGINRRTSMANPIISSNLNRFQMRNVFYFGQIETAEKREAQENEKIMWCGYMKEDVDKYLTVENRKYILKHKLESTEIDRLREYGYTLDEVKEINALVLKNSVKNGLALPREQILYDACESYSLWHSAFINFQKDWHQSKRASPFSSPMVR